MQFIIATKGFYSRLVIFCNIYYVKLTLQVSLSERNAWEQGKLEAGEHLCVCTVDSFLTGMGIKDFYLEHNKGYFNLQAVEFESTCEYHM